MTPVRTARSNMVYRGPTPDVGDAWTESVPGAAYLVWELTPEDREAIALGANLRLGVFQHPMPPVSLDVTVERRLSPEGARWHERARAIYRTLLVRGPLDIPKGFWRVSEDVWADLQATGALDVTDIPLLCGRPLLQVAGTDVLDFAAAEDR